MKLESIFNLLKDSGIHKIYPISAPENKPCSIIDITGGTPSRGGVNEVYLRIITNESHPTLAIDKAHEIRKYLQDKLKGAFFDGKKILHIETDTPQPLSIGEENGIFTVSWNYTILESE